MTVCDRCGKKITKKTDDTRRSLFIYSAAANGIWHGVDLCEDCLYKLENYKKIAGSYFMVNKDNPRDIFIKVKYWSD